MRREFAITVESDFPLLREARGFVRIDGDITAGSTVRAEGLLPNGPGDQIPDEWNMWQGPRTHVVGDDNYVSIRIKKSLGWITARVTVISVSGKEYLVGSGNIFGFDFKITKSKRYLLDDTVVIDLKAEYELKKLYAGSEAQFKCSGICVEDNGTIVMGVYGNDAPRNRSMIYHDGQRVWPASGFNAAETLTPYPNGYIVAENGLQIRRTDQYRHTQCRCKWAVAYANGVVFTAESSDGRIEGRDFNTGAKKYSIEGTNVPHEAELLPDGVIVVAVEDFGLSFTDGRPSIRCKPRGMHVIDSRILVGDSGYLKEVVDGKLVNLIEGKIGEVIDSITSDAAGIWFATSNPDACYLLPHGSKSPQLIGAKFDDAKQGGSLFGCEVATNGSKRVFMRNNANAGNKWEVYEIVEPSTDDLLTNATWWADSTIKRQAGAFKVVSSLQITGFKGSVGNFIFTKFASPCELCIHRYHNGKLVGGPIDGIDPDGNASKTIENYLYARRHGPNSESENAKALTPAYGEEVFFSIICPELKQRTSPCKYPFPLKTSQQTEPKPPVNTGGDGLYKPETRLWLLPLGPKASQIRVAAEYKPGGILVKYLRIGVDAGEKADGWQSDADKATFYHNNRVVLRDAVVSANGNSLIAWTKAGKKYMMTVKDRSVRQEGKS